MFYVEREEVITRSSKRYEGGHIMCILRLLKVDYCGVTKDEWKESVYTVLKNERVYLKCGDRVTRMDVTGTGGMGREMD